jgi:phosphonopyruvate decarboxylase
LIQAEEFVEPARKLGFKRYTGVPCSFLTPFINFVINDANLDYISSANEGDALATAAGAAIGGERSIVMMQNSGLGNAVSPITSLTWVFRIPMIIITTHRGAPGVKDEPQHELIGQITGELFDTMQVPWEPFPDKSELIEPALERAFKYMQQENRPYGFIMRKGTVSDHPLKKDAITNRPGKDTQRNQFSSKNKNLLSRKEVLQHVITLTPEDDTVIIATTGFTGRELFALSDRSNQLYMVGSMGNFATIGSYGGSNLTHLVLDNEAHDSTGAQATVSSNVRFADIAQACGYAICYEGTDIQLINELFSQDKINGPRFGHLKIKTGTMENLPRPDITPNKVLQRLMQHINTSF